MSDEFDGDGGDDDGEDPLRDEIQFDDKALLSKVFGTLSGQSLVPRPVELPPKSGLASGFMRAKDFVAGANEVPTDLVDRWIPGGSPRILLSGPPGSLKTFIALELAYAVSNGVKAFGQFTAQKGQVLIIEEEHHPGNFKKRLLHAGVDLDNVVTAHRTGFRLDQAYPPLQRLCAAMRGDPEFDFRLIILDPLADLHDKDEMSAFEMNSVIRALDTITRANPNCAMLVLHHTTKASWGKGSAMSSARGTSRVQGAFDVLYDLSHPEEVSETVRRVDITCHKNKDSERGLSPHVLECDFSGPAYGWKAELIPGKKRKTRRETSEDEANPEPDPVPEGQVRLEGDTPEDAVVRERVTAQIAVAPVPTISVLCDQLGTRRDRVARALRDLQKLGAIDKVGGNYVLKK